MISLVVNTACLGLRAGAILSSGKRPHDLREFLLKCFIIPEAMANPAISEIIVAGEFEPGEGYTYVRAPSVYFNCRDALHQRQRGFEAATGDVILFQHDDHLVQGDFPPMEVFTDTQVVVPQRRTRMRQAIGERLNAGEGRYVSGHAAFYSREAITKCPWGQVPKVYQWDRAHTEQLLDAGFRVGMADQMMAWDIEWGSQPWR
jgi:hypothetical protein